MTDWSAVFVGRFSGFGVIRVGPFVRDYEAERLFLCCVVRVGYWPDQPVVRSRVVASFFLTRALLFAVVREFVTRGRVSTWRLEVCGRRPTFDDWISVLGNRLPVDILRLTTADARRPVPK
ncbi:hypothetical protein Taro_035625, partial [Colocasia esculenta]|nr:hypothetical protein [Colocasia esculenta]